MFKVIESHIKKTIVNSFPWTNTYGLARTLIALATGLILIINPSYYLFDLTSNEVFESNSVGGFFNAINVFHWFPNHINFVQKVAGLVLLFIATGIYPRFTGIIHWWITFSFFSAASTLNGGDQLANSLTLLFIPLALTDPRNHIGIKSIPISNVLNIVICMDGYRSISFDSKCFWFIFMPLPAN